MRSQFPLSLLAWLTLLTTACGSDDNLVATDNYPGAGGTSNAGGTPSTGGLPATGGKSGSATGGAVFATGGSSGSLSTGGTLATGGKSGSATGGTVFATGGSSGSLSTGGTLATGGKSGSATGGTVFATGGSSGSLSTGGTLATGGKSGSATGGAVLATGGSSGSLSTGGTLATGGKSGSATGGAVLATGGSGGNLPTGGSSSGGGLATGGTSGGTTCASVALDPSRLSAYLINGQIYFDVFAQLSLIIPTAYSWAPEAEVTSPVSGTLSCPLVRRLSPSVVEAYTTCQGAVIGAPTCGQTLPVSVHVWSNAYDSANRPLCSSVDPGPSVTVDVTLKCPTCPPDAANSSGTCDFPMAASCPGNTTDYQGNPVTVPCQCLTVTVGQPRIWTCPIA
jgi:hypothetical protein